MKQFCMRNGWKARFFCDKILLKMKKCEKFRSWS